MTAPRRKLSTDRVIRSPSPRCCARRRRHSLADGDGQAAEEAVTIPAPAVDPPEERRSADGDLRRRLLLGRPGRVPACRGRRERRLGLCRRHGRQSELRAGQRPARPATPRRSRSRYDPQKVSLRQAPADLLLGRPRPDPAQPPGPGHRHAVPLGDLFTDDREQQQVAEAYIDAARRGRASIPARSSPR